MGVGDLAGDAVLAAGATEGTEEEGDVHEWWSVLVCGCGRGVWLVELVVVVGLGEAREKKWEESESG